MTEPLSEEELTEFREYPSLTWTVEGATRLLATIDSIRESLN